MTLFSPDFVTGPIIDGQANSGKPYETNSEAATNANDKSIDNKQPESFNINFRTAANELKIQNVVRLPTSCKSLDSLLDGGIETGQITQVYRPPGSGKTQLCHTLCVMSASDYRVIYIDTEGSFRPERIETIAKARVSR
jgi:RecA/RadA recombinase